MKFTKKGKKKRWFNTMNFVHRISKLPPLLLESKFESFFFLSLKKKKGKGMKGIKTTPFSLSLHIRTVYEEETVMTNYLAIELNNMAVAEIQAGSLCKGLELISWACNLTTQRRNNDDDHDTEVDSATTAYKFHWVDCNNEILRMNLTGQPCLYMNLLRITTTTTTSQDDEMHVNISYPCRFSWAVWYK